ncbi:MAG: DNA adenine methylase [bacterium]
MMGKRVKPFLKWAGGKSQLLEQFELYFPVELKEGLVKRYIEPFVGGGAVFFHIAQKYPIQDIHLYDINEELILAFTVVQKNVDDLIEQLKNIESAFLKNNDEKRQKYFYKIRDTYNKQKSEVNFKRYSKKWISRAAHIFFLNRTCFNGLFRVNKASKFNVPFGRYKNPTICDDVNLRNASSLLKNATIRCTNFSNVVNEADENTFIYYDPPYRPLSRTSNFTSYSKCDFNDEEQKRLAETFNTTSKKGVKQMLSNSDPKSVDPKDAFFDALYSDFNIHRVHAARMINSNASKRGRISELLITNY